MLKRRIIPIQLLVGGRLVKTVRFGAYRDVGDPVASSKVYNAQNADELVFLNIDREDRSVAPMLRLLERVSEEVFMPLALGGGIRSVDDASRLIRAGADKVVVNSAVYRDPDVLRGIADRFGAQAVVVGIDVRRNAESGRYVPYSDCGRRREEVGLDEHVERVVEHGAGEILVNSIDRDGTMEGYDLELIRRVVERSPAPVIGCGGAGHYNHLKEGFLEAGASALACGSLFNFGDNNPIRAKAFLTNYGIPFKVV
ncbi:MAG TPA: imidazole glycerol phosphate synthase cyclase subunit [Longimicrobiaceae bacterium]|nr:imidazole glycerol phosphate synthase cyclase subunit [Longimicrobiaceae bacterium]